MQLAIEYLLVVFLASLGVLQGVAARGQLRGLWFFKKAPVTYLFAVLALGVSFGWFFLSQDGNGPGLEGFQQFLFFTMGAFLALLVTLLVSSLLKGRALGGSAEKGMAPGLDALKQMTYFQALRRSLGLGKER